MSGARKTGLMVVFVIIVVVLFALAFGFVMYRAGSFPAFNALVDGLVGNESVVVHEPLPASNDAEVTPELVATFDSVAGRIPVLFECVDGVPAHNEEPLPFDVSISGKYEVASLQPEWRYLSDYPVVTKPGVFSDMVVFMDMEPALVCIDRVTGLVSARFPCGVFPSGEAFVTGLSYFFEARSGGWYELRFVSREDAGTDAVALEPVFAADDIDSLVDADHLLASGVFPDAAVMDKIVERMRGLLPPDDMHSETDAILYAQDDEICSFERRSLSPLFVFSPEEQGSYVVGLCDADGAWIRDSSFVAVFSRSGEMKMVSLDYVADRPQVTMHLSNEELYYICAGSMDNAMSGKAAYFQVRKAP